MVREEVVEHLFTHVTRFLLCLSLSLAQLAKSQLLHSQYSEGNLDGLKKLSWYSVRFYSLGHFDLSQPELMRECIVCLVVSGMTAEVRRSLWSVFKTPPPLLPLLNLGLHSWITQVVWPAQEASQTVECDQEDTACLFSTGTEHVSQCKAQASSETEEICCYWALSSCC